LQDGCRLLTTDQKRNREIISKRCLDYSSSDLAACDFFLFPNLEKWLERNLNVEIIDAVNSYFEEKDKSLLEKA